MEHTTPPSRRRLRGSRGRHHEGPAGHRAGRSLVGALGAGIAAVVGVVGRLRRGRPLHPVGAVLTGHLVRYGGATTGAAWIDTGGQDDVLVRLSRGGGFPPPLPDVHGLSFRHGQADVLLSSAIRAPVLRHVPIPTPWPWLVGYTSVMPFLTPTGPVVIAARPAGTRRVPAAMTELAAELERAPWPLDLQWSRLGGRWHTFARLTVGGPARPGLVDGPERFDFLAAPPGLTVPGWVRALRAPSYVVARRYPARYGPADPDPPVGTETSDSSTDTSRRVA